MRPVAPPPRVIERSPPRAHGDVAPQSHPPASAGNVGNAGRGGHAHPTQRRPQRGPEVFVRVNRGAPAQRPRLRLSTPSSAAPLHRRVARRPRRPRPEAAPAHAAAEGAGGADDHGPIVRRARRLGCRRNGRAHPQQGCDRERGPRGGHRSGGGRPSPSGRWSRRRTSARERASERSVATRRSRAFPRSSRTSPQVRGVATGWGSGASGPYISRRSDPFVTHFEETGVVTLGKSATPELGLTATTEPLGRPLPQPVGPVPLERRLVGRRGHAGRGRRRANRARQRRGRLESASRPRAAGSWA